MPGPARSETDADGGGDGDVDGAPVVTRRAVLTSSAAALGAGAVGAGGLAGATGVTAGQITEAGAIPAVERWPDANLAGFMVHVGGSVDPTEARAAEECEMGWSDTWPPDEILSYDARLINRKDGDTPETETTLYIGGSVDVEAGQLYIINRFQRCESDFVGLSLEQIGHADVGGGPVADVEEDERPNAGTTGTGEGGSGAFGPGFGPLAAVAGLLGGGAFLRRRGDDED